MTAVITGDIINSRKTPPRVWMRTLKKTLSSFGSTPKQWEIIRGDSFQLQIKDSSKALHTALIIRAALIAIPHPGLDARIAIGFGKKTYSAQRVSESNGPAFIRSGMLLEELKSSTKNIAVSTGSSAFDEELNILLTLGEIAIGRWTANAAEAVQIALLHPEWPQEKIGRALKIRQNAVSARLKRAYFEEVKSLLQLFEQKIKTLK